MIIHIKNKYLLWVFGWRRFPKQGITCGHKLWWLWLKEHLKGNYQGKI